MITRILCVCVYVSSTVHTVCVCVFLPGSLTVTLLQQLHGGQQHSAVLGVSDVEFVQVLLLQQLEGVQVLITVEQEGGQVFLRRTTGRRSGRSDRPSETLQHGRALSTVT